MANIPQKSKDPTEEALSAIQEALDRQPGRARAPRQPRHARRSRTAHAPPPVAADLFNEEPQAGQLGRRRGAAAPRRQ